MQSSFPNFDATSVTLVQKVQAGVPSAWHRMLDLYGPIVYGWCRRSKLQESDAVDVGQEVFSAVARSVASFEVGKGTFRGWLWTITRNKLNDFYRRQSNQPQPIGGTDANLMVHQLPEHVPGEDEVAELSSITRRLLDEVRTDFEDSTWNAFWRCVIQSSEPADVADELGVSRWTVYKARSRVLARLRERLTELGEY